MLYDVQTLGGVLMCDKVDLINISYVNIAMGPNVKHFYTLFMELSMTFDVQNFY